MDRPQHDAPQDKPTQRAIGYAVPGRNTRRYGEQVDPGQRCRNGLNDGEVHEVTCAWRETLQQQEHHREGRNRPECSAYRETADNLHAIDPGLKWECVSTIPYR